MPVRELEGPGSRRHGEQLVAEADTEDRAPEPLHHPPELPGEVLEVPGIAGAVPEHDPGGVPRRLGERFKPRDAVDPRAPGDQRAHDVVLGAHVHEQHLGSVLGAVGGRGAGHHLFEDLPAHFDRRGPRPGIRRGEPGGAEDAPHRSGFAKTHGECAGVHPLDPGHPFGGEPGAERPDSRVVAVPRFVVLHHESLDLDPPRLERALDGAFGPRRGNAVVPLERIGQHQDLSPVRRVREGLHVPRHAGVEHDFPGHRWIEGRAEGTTRKFGAVFEVKSYPAACGAHIRFRTQTGGKLYQFAALFRPSE